MKYKDIRFQYGLRFSFIKDAKKFVLPRNTQCMIVDGRGYLRGFSAIVDLHDGRLSEFGEYDDIIFEDIILQDKG